MVNGHRLVSRLPGFSSLLAFALAAACCLSLLRFSSLPIILTQLLLCILALWNRRWPLYALVLCFPLFGNQPGAPYALYILDLSLWFIVGRWLWGRWRQGRSPIIQTSLTPWLCALWLMSAASLLPWTGELLRHIAYHDSPSHAIFAVYQSSVFEALWPIHALLDLTLSFLLVFLLCDEWRSRRARFRLLRNLWIALLVAMVWGLFDFTGIASLEWFRPPNPEILQFGYPRLQSFFWHSGWFAEWIALLAPFGLAFSLCPAPARMRRWRIAGCIASVFGLLIMLLTYQRGGWLALAAGYGTVAILVLWLRVHSGVGWLRARYILIAAMILLAVSGMGIAVLAAQADTALGRRLRHTVYLSDRTMIWKSALALSRQNPVLGVGFGRFFQAHMQAFPEGHPYFHVEKGEAHNTYLHFLAERGPAALFLMLLIMGVLLWRLAHFWVRGYCSGRTQWVIGGTGMIAAWMVYACAQYLPYIRMVDITFWILAAFLLSETGSVARHGVRRCHSRPPDRIRGKFSPEGSNLLALIGNNPRSTLFWLSAPLLLVIFLAFAHHILSPSGWIPVPAAAPFWQGPFGAALFLAAGCVPWFIAVGSLSPILRGNLRTGNLLLLQSIRAVLLLAWLMLFLAFGAFFFESPIRGGLFPALGLSACLLLALLLSLLLGRFRAILALDRLPSPLQWGFGIAWFLATPVVWPITHLPAPLRWLALLNPACAPVRIAQDLIYFQVLPNWTLWAALAGWIAALFLIIEILGLRRPGRAI